MKKFTQISKEASKKNWCWNLTCTTCGSVELMFEITKAVFPNAKKGINRFSHNNPISYQQRVLEFFVEEIDIKELQQESIFPDWLGHIGLLLSSCKKAESESKILSKNILPQFLSIIKGDIFRKDIELMIENEQVITLPFLESIEFNIAQNKNT